MNHPKWKWIASVLIVFAGLWLFTDSCGQLNDQRQIHNWPTSDGTIVHSGVDNSESNMPLIVYRFVVNGAEYIDTTSLGAPGFGGKRKRWEYARQLLSQYPESAKVTIHYNPADPHDSAIRTSVSFEVYTRLSFGICLVFSGLLWAGAMWRRREQ